MVLDGTYPLSSSILIPIKEKIEALMKAFKDPTDTDFVWNVIISSESWYLHNTLSVPWKRYPVVFIVVTRVRQEPGAINYQRKWTVELQIEFYFADYNDEQEDVALDWVEEVDRLTRKNPHLGQPDPTAFKVLKWQATDSAIDYFLDDNHLLMQVICQTEVVLFDCRTPGGP